jgi:uncharacterized protein
MRVILDTNVLLSAFVWGGAPRQLLNLARGGQLDAFTSPALLDELARVLREPKFDRYLSNRQLNADELLRGLTRLVHVVFPLPLALPVCRDPDDDAVLACAVAARASIIVSGDNDLLSMESYEGIAILNARDAIALIGELKAATR